jgi:hypothetical protein
MPHMITFDDIAHWRALLAQWEALTREGSPRCACCQQSLQNFETWRLCGSCNALFCPECVCHHRVSMHRSSLAP